MDLGQSHANGSPLGKVPGPALPLQCSLNKKDKHDDPADTQQEQHSNR